MEVLQPVWLFIQNEVLGMQWLNRLLGRMMEKMGAPMSSRWATSV